MPGKRTTSKRKLNTSQTETQQVVPAKISKKKLSLVARSLVERAPGQVLTIGQGDVGQLGLGPDRLECTRPARVQGLDDIVYMCAGGMHSVCLDSKGQVITFGCNDEGALGRQTSTEGSETLPGKVELVGKAVQISAGDSHSAALLEDGRVYVWGAFRDLHGTMGLTKDSPHCKGVEKPTLVAISKVTMIASGNDHLLLLTQQGKVYSCGCGEQGQLGRLPERGATRNSRKGLNQLLIPSLVNSKKMNMEIENIWAGGYSSFAIDKNGKVYVFGLNNYKQLGLDNMESYFYPSVSEVLSNRSWVKICADQHHTIALNADGVVYTLGRKEYGRLGLGALDDCSEVGKPTVVTALENKKCVDVACGSSCSFAVTDKGEVYSWGMGSSGQLGTGDEDDHWEPTLVKGKQLEGASVVAVSGGGQHTILLSHTNDPMDQS